MSKWIICASGPSMGRVDVRMLRRHRSWRVMAINCTHRLVPWADALYASDGQWWDRYVVETVGFAGERWTRDQLAAVKYGLRWVHRSDKPGLCRDRLTVSSGGNSGYQAINLAFHFGARRIVLLGYDMHRKEGGHWHGEHEGMLSAPARHIPIWRQAFPALAHDLHAEGVQVVNATEGSALDCFPRMELAEALRC